MKHTVMLIPIRVGVGLNAVAHGLVRAITNRGVNVGLFEPIIKDEEAIYGQKNYCLTESSAEKYLRHNNLDDLLEKVLVSFYEFEKNYDFCIVRGLIATLENPFVTEVNKAIAKALDAAIVFVSVPGTKTPEAFLDKVQSVVENYGGVKNQRVLGLIVNKIGAPVDKRGTIQFDLTQTSTSSSIEAYSKQLKSSPIFDSNFVLIGCLPWDDELVAPRVKDVASLLKAKVLFAGDMDERRVLKISLCARNVSHILSILIPGALIITAGDRVDVVLATALAALSGVTIAGLVLTGDYELSKETEKLCEAAINGGLPILSTAMDSFTTAATLNNLNLEVPLDDAKRWEFISDYIADRLDHEWVDQVLQIKLERHLSTAAFRYNIVESAKSAGQTIILPEGNEIRTIEAASACALREIAKIILLGNPDEIQGIANNRGITLNHNIRVMDPETIRDHYLEELVLLRKDKGLTQPVAREMLRDNVVLATMMLYLGEVDGLVSGAVHTTANTIRPALQIIKTAPANNLVSSVFFMCLPQRIMVYGDCAINPSPTAEQLADIAMQSAATAQKFGLVPKVAMISYSTGTSGSGVEVEKVRKATELVQARKPELVIDGPLQYDAAINPDVAAKKAPNSPVAGQANVVIFPDLNTGNTTYKAVQRSADVLSIGPILQGLNKPVNDLSRGATVEDIIYTIAITAIQAGS